MWRRYLQGGYNPFMKTFLFILTIFVLAGFAAPAYAEKDEALPPPTEVKDTKAAKEMVVVPEDDADLTDEFDLQGKDKVTVRTYEREKDGATINEYSSHGHVYMVKVQPKGDLPAYYLYDRNGDGVFETRLPGGYKRISPPTWVIKRF